MHKNMMLQGKMDKNFKNLILLFEYSLEHKLLKIINCWYNNDVNIIVGDTTKKYSEIIEKYSGKYITSPDKPKAFAGNKAYPFNIIVVNNANIASPILP
uniref:Glyco_trans_2-like domain-containing protein n=1 Tax=Parastrongyloides trichosuri TaxID=131310 RepID=A0A0N4ZQH3_PARTI